jgi:hypothetical protein
VDVNDADADVDATGDLDGAFGDFVITVVVVPSLDVEGDRDCDDFRTVGDLAMAGDFDDDEDGDFDGDFDLDGDFDFDDGDLEGGVINALCSPGNVGSSSSSSSVSYSPSASASASASASPSIFASSPSVRSITTSG